MEKHDFMYINDLIYQLYTEKSLQQLKSVFLKRLKKIVPYSYASILAASRQDEVITLIDPVCNPASFTKAEIEYLQLEDIDHTNWIFYSPESVIIRESELMNDRSRLATPIYQKCYRNYNIFDTLQMSIVYEHVFYGVLTLYRTREDGSFTSEEMFCLQALSKHLNYIFYLHTDKPNTHDYSTILNELTRKYCLTRRESEILGYIFDGLSNPEILEKIPITEHTLQKHLQNLYRKCGVSARWELLRLK